MFFFNVQQMFAQLATYLVFSILLYHSSRTFKFINTFPYQERVFCIKTLVLTKSIGTLFR